MRPGLCAPPERSDARGDLEPLLLPVGSTTSTSTVGNIAKASGLAEQIEYQLM